MHQHLLDTIEQFKNHYFSDTRCIGMYIHGSTARGTDDEYSDVDLGIVVQDEEYDAVKSQALSLCEKHMRKGSLVVSGK